jgi:transposase
MQEPSANSVYHHLFLLVSDVQLIGEVDEQKVRQKRSLSMWQWKEIQEMLSKKSTK